MRKLVVSGTGFLADGKHFPFTGVSFFNAIFNPAFNRGPEQRRRWMQRFLRHGINVLRVWAQWDARHAFVDMGPDATLYERDGGLRQAHVERLRGLVADADRLGMVVELALFSQESKASGLALGGAAADRAVKNMAKELRPHRNLVFQIWNECSDRVLDHVKSVKAVDPERLVTNSPGFAGVLGDSAQNRALDFLTPHTTRAHRHWQIAPREIAGLIAAYNKPVVDDEPARNGTPEFGGPGEPTDPLDHILHMYGVWMAGGHVVSHHDMFQTGYGTPSIPPNGIPDPQFSPYHRRVFRFLAMRERYSPSAENDSCLPEPFWGQER